MYWRQESTIHNVTTWVLCVTRYLERIALCSAFHRCILDTTRISSIDTIEQWDNESAPLVTMMIEDEYVKFNVQEEGYYFDWTSDDTTMDGFGWTTWFKLSPSVHNLCIERSVDDSVCSIWRVIPCLIWRTTKVWDVMHTSIHSMSNKTGNWMYRVTDSSISHLYKHNDE